jgi:hypothetical protein
MSQVQIPFPLYFKGELTEPLSRWLWLIKWLLLFLHYIVLCFLWVAFIMLTILAFLAILATKKYPRSVFDFNVGVLRWTWRVGFYSYQALGTDNYPPFTLKAVSYSADLGVGYQRRHSRSLVLVKRWLLAIPQYIVVSVYWGSLVFIMVIFSAVAILFRGRYPKDIFDFVLGMNRWSYRVAAYAALMSNRYPPFRLGD